MPTPQRSQEMRKMSSSALADEAPVPKKRKTATTVAPLTAPLPASMAEVPAMAPMSVLEKAADVPSTAPAKKKPSSSSKDKKGKGKGSSDPATATEDPIAKKLKIVDVRTSAAEPPTSSGAAAAAIDVARLVAGSRAVQAIATASSAFAAMTLSYVLPAPRSSLSMLQDAHADGHTPRQSLYSLSNAHGNAYNFNFLLVLHKWMVLETHGDDMTLVVKGHSWSDWSEHTSAKRNQVNNEYDRIFLS